MNTSIWSKDEVINQSYEVPSGETVLNRIVSVLESPKQLKIYEKVQFFIAINGAGQSFTQTITTTTAQAHPHKYFRYGLIEELPPSPTKEEKKSFIFNLLSPL